MEQNIFKVTGLGTWTLISSLNGRSGCVPKENGAHAQTTLPGMDDGQLHIQEWEEVWTGDFIFENEWQSCRTKNDRSLELKTPFHEC